jgi:hypothetical protein
MIRRNPLWLLLALLILIPSFLFGQYDLFRRAGTIPMAPIENSGWGNMIGGVDLDKDGKPEIYTVNNDWNDTGNELIPRIYKYELDSAKWKLVWSATLNIPLQNTWPALTYGDWDGDGKMEVIWGPVNNTGAGNPNPPRIVVFEDVGDGSDNMGVPDGSGGWKPNAEWTIVTTDNYNLRPFRWQLTDIDNDGKPELVFVSRVAGERFGIVSVSDIPWLRDVDDEEIGPWRDHQLIDTLRYGRH